MIFLCHVHFLVDAEFKQRQGVIMVKKIAIAFFSMVLSSTLYAENISESSTFIGLEVGYAEVQGDVGYLLGDMAVIQPNFVGDYDVEFGIKIGAQRDQWRTAFIFDYYDSADNDQNVEKGYLTIDYFVLEKESAVRPYIGLNVGYASYESTFVEDSGFLYGAQAGIVLGIAEMVNLDLGYRYSLSDADALDHIGSAVFGINYIF